jgi:hypothetical protein
MSALIPVIVVVLALVAAGSIAYIAWQLTSKDVQDQLERSLGRPRDPAAGATTRPSPPEGSDPPVEPPRPGEI